MTDAVETAAEACERLLGERPVGIETPGGRSRDSARLHVASRSIIVTRRGNAKRAELEVFVLRELAGHGVPVPAVLAFDGTWILQEDLGPLRLSQALAAASPREGEALLAAAVAGLTAIHAAGRATGLSRRVATLGAKPGWRTQLIDTPGRIGRHLDLPAPALPVSPLRQQLAVRQPSFLKWDARPANAIAQADGSVAWFDWEHCGCRNPLDDLAWLFGDEYVPDWPAVEARLLGIHLPAFTAGEDAGAAEDYLRTMGSLHMCVRLALILSKKGSGPWWDGEVCLAKDRVGVTAPLARRTCLRAARWAARTSLLQPLAPWLHEVAVRLDEAG